MSAEQFGFLSNQQIFNAVGIMQESLYLVKVKKLNDFILKMDLEKAYDNIDCSFLRLILLHVGLTLNISNWIMSCVSSAKFAILINGSRMYFFKGDRGIRQGFPLLP